MQNRELFVDKPKSNKNTNKAKIVAAYHSSGAIYNYFELILPKNSKVIRLNKNTIVIETSMFSLSITILFGGFGTVIPNKFEKYYIGINNFGEANIYEFNIKLTFKFKLLSFIYSDKWKYYDWADNLINRIDNYISKDSFFERINWDTIETLLECQRIGNEQKNKNN